MNFNKLLAAMNSVGMRLFASQLTVAGTALLVNVFAARTLGPEARGELALFMQIAYVANALSILGRDRAYLKKQTTGAVSLATAHQDVRTLTRTPLLIAALAATLTAAILEQAVWAGIFFGAGMLSLTYSGVQQKMLRSSAIMARNALPYFVATLVGQVLLLAGAVTLTHFNISVVAAWLATYGMAVLVPYAVLSLRYAMAPADSGSPEDNLGSVKLLGLKLVPMSIAQIVGSRIDRFLLPALANYTQLGIYTVVVTMTELIAWPIKNATDARVPVWATQIREHQLAVWREVVLVSAAILGLMGIVGMGLQLVLVPLFGAEYTAGVQLIWPLVLAAGLHAWAHLGANLSLAAGFTGLVNAIPITGMAVSAASYVVLIPDHGALGAAWGLVCGYALSCVVALTSMVRIARGR